MGLIVSHGAWDGGYSSFMTWRRKIAEIAGLPPLDLMENFYTAIGTSGFPTLYCGNPDNIKYLQHLDDMLPIKWSSLKKDPLHILLTHSDCDGYIKSSHCLKIAKRLEMIIDLMPEGEGPGHVRNWKETTQNFIEGLKFAAESKENLIFR